jgi:hypothetical protein
LLLDIARQRTCGIAAKDPGERIARSPLVMGRRERGTNDASLATRRGSR